MLGAYRYDEIENEKSLVDFLKEKENNGEIESIEESEAGTQTIIIDGYRVTIQEETLEIIEIGKALPRPKFTNIKITVMQEDGTEIEASEQEVVQGTPLKVSFDVTFEEGTLIGANKGSLENGKVEYMTDGTQTEVIFVVTGQTREEIETKQTKKLY